MKLHYLIGAFFLMGVLLYAIGLPLPNIAAGISFALYLTWKKNRTRRINARQDH
jgi:Na+-driven multidrug efflux pump